MVVWGFFSNGYVVNVVFLNVCIVDMYKFCFSMQFVDSIIVGQIYIGVQVVYLLVNDFFQVIFIGYVIFDIFWYQFVGSVIVLEIMVRGIFGYCVQGIYIMVRFVRMVLVEFDFIWRFFSICQYGIYYYCVCVSGDSFGDVVGEVNIVISDNWNIGVFQGFYCVSNSGNLWNIDVSYDMSCIDRVRVNVDFNCIVISFCQSVCICSCCYVVVDNLQIRIFSMGFMDMLQYIF